MALDIQGTDFLKLPVGTTTQRPSIPASGMIRQNSTTGFPEWWDATTSAWIQFNQAPGYTISYLVVAGGGGGGADSTLSGSSGAGGGAGGLRNGSLNLSIGTVYTITVGAGGAANGTATQGSTGSNSVFSTIISNGGGGGGGSNLVSGGQAVAGSAGGSGIVIISYAGAQRGTGGTVTSVGGNTIHTFTSSSTFTA